MTQDPRPGNAEIEEKVTEPLQGRAQDEFPFERVWVRACRAVRVRVCVFG